MKIRDENNPITEKFSLLSIELFSGCLAKDISEKLNFIFKVL